MVRLALSKGRVEQQGGAWLHAHGLAAPATMGRGLIWSARPSLEVVLVRGRDIPRLLRAGVVDMGLLGRDVALESGEPLWLSQGLGFGVCRLVLAAPEGFAFGPRPARIATRFPSLTRGWCERKGLRADVVTLGGSIEAAPALGLADAVVDVVETGATLRANGLRPLDVLLESSAVLTTNVGQQHLAKPLLEPAAPTRVRNGAPAWVDA